MAHTYSEELYSDLYKDARGYRPKQEAWEFWNSLDADGKQRQWDALVGEMEASEKRREALEKASIEAFEAKVAKLIKLGARDRNAAISIIFDQAGADDDVIFGDPDYFCYANNLPYGFFKDVTITRA